jgi:hypothetical protein
MHVAGSIRSYPCIPGALLSLVNQINTGKTLNLAALLLGFFVWSQKPITTTTTTTTTTKIEVYKVHADMEEGVNSYWITLRKQESTGR